MTGLNPVASLWARAVRRIELAWWEWARHDLQQQNAAHADLPTIVRRIRELQP